MFRKLDFKKAAYAACDYKKQPCPGKPCAVCHLKGMEVLRASGALQGEPPWLWPIGTVVVLLAIYGFARIVVG